MTDYLQTGYAAHVLDVQLVSESLRGNGVATGVSPSRSGALETSVTAGTTFVDGTPLTFASSGDQSAVHDGGDTDPRRDIVYIANVSGDAVLDVYNGTPGAPVHAQGDDTVAFSDAPFEFAAPAPPIAQDIPGTPIAEVAIPAGATDYTEATHLRDLRQFTDLTLEKLVAHSELNLPAYDETSNAPAVTDNIIRITGNGSDAEGVYVYDGASYVNLGEQITLNDLVIDSSRDWGGYDITNVGRAAAGTLHASDNFRVDGGRGSFSLPDQHAEYADGLTDAEIARWSLAAGESLEVTLLEVTHLGGGSSTNFAAELRDESDGSTLVSTTDSVRGSPAATSAAGADITLRVSNSTGGAVKATISGQLFRVN